MHLRLKDDTAPLQDALDDLDRCMATILRLEPRLAGWHSVCAAARLLDMGVHTLAGSEDPTTLARIIVLTAQVEKLIEQDMPGRLAR